MIKKIKSAVLASIEEVFKISADEHANIDIVLNTDKLPLFGDLSCNAALILASTLKRSPLEIAEQLCENLKSGELCKNGTVSTISVARPGFVNITLANETWNDISKKIFSDGPSFFSLDEDEKKLSYLVEFVSPNPTGPLHLAHGRNAIIGDVLARVMEFLGHKVSREMYINDAGKQIDLLGESLLARYKQQLKEDVQVPEKGYHGEYLSDVALEIVKERGSDAVNEPMEYFKRYAVDKMLILIKKDLLLYGVEFDTFFSEKTLHDNGAIDKAVEDLKTNQLVYEKDDALWFKSTEFGDDKDRVVKRSDGAWTYLGADIAYHEDKFKRGYDKLIDVLGQDHHGYLNRIKATMEAMGFGKDKLDIIVYQLVFMRIGNDYVKMSKRSGNFETLSDVINTVGKDVARFFYLNRKADAHLDFDLDVALKNTEENPVYYIQYAYVRINSLMNKAAEISGMSEWVSKLRNGEIDTDGLSLDENDIALVRKISQLSGILRTIANGYQTHMIAYYTLELAKNFSSYYGKVKILDTGRIDATKNRLFVVSLIRTTLGTCLDLLGLSKPEKM